MLCPYHAAFVNLLERQSRTVPAEDRPVVVVERKQRRYCANDAACQDVAVVVPIVNAARDRDPGREDYRRAAQEQHQRLLAASQRRAAAILAVETRSTQHVKLQTHRRHDTESTSVSAGSTTVQAEAKRRIQTSA